MASPKKELEAALAVKDVKTTTNTATTLTNPDKISSMRTQAVEGNFNPANTTGTVAAGVNGIIIPNSVSSGTAATALAGTLPGATVVDETPTVPETPTTTTTFDDSAYQAALAKVMANYQNAENERARALEQNYQNALAQAQSAYNSGKNNLRQTTDDALRQAYISYMLGQRGLNQQLANGGINGGALESVLANLYNNYGGNRASIENTYNSNLADLTTNYNSQVANLGANYNTNYADVLADYNSQVANTQNSYASTLANLLAKQQAETIAANASPTAKETRATAVNTFAKYVNNPAGARAYANQLIASGKYTADEVDELLFEAGISPEEIANYFAE